MPPKPRTPSDRVRTVAYLRVSTEKQVDKVSLPAQRAKVESYAKLYDLELVAIEVDDGESAKSLDRPALQRALAMLRDGRAGALLVVKLDRLTRSVRDLADLVEMYFAKDAALLSVSEQIDTRSAAGRMVLNILTVIGQWEREAISERTLAAMQYLREHGKKTGGDLPYGYRLAKDGKTLRPHAPEQRVIGKARELKLRGWSFRAIARTLALEGLRPREGKRFHHEQIKRWLDVADDAGAE